MRDYRKALEIYMKKPLPSVYEIECKEKMIELFKIILGMVAILSTIFLGGLDPILF